MTDLPDLHDPNPGNSPVPLPPAEFSADDAGNGERLAWYHGRDLRYVHARGRWYVWRDTHWTEDDTGEVHLRAKDTARSIFNEAARAAEAGDDKRAEMLSKHAAASLRHTGLRNMVTRGGTEPPIPVRPEDFDADPWALNTPTGTVDLRTGALRPHDREDLLTKVTGGQPTPELLADPSPYPGCPTFGAFLERILPDPDVRAFLQRLIGQALIGEVKDHILPIPWGDGANGKSTLIGALTDALGDYVQQAPATLLLAGRTSDGPSPELLRLRGARLVVCSETDQSARLNEALVKQLTGGDRLVARMPYGRDFEEWTPTHTAVMVTNHKPAVRGTDSGIWRRLLLIPFDQTIPEHERDPALPDRLAAEAAGILTWAIHGATAWQRDGLGPPERVSVATELYRAEMDLVGAWLADRTVQVHGATARGSDLYADYREWCSHTGLHPLAANKFGPDLEKRGFEKTRDRRGACYRGLGLATERSPL